MLQIMFIIPFRIFPKITLLCLLLLCLCSSLLSIVNHTRNKIYKLAIITSLLVAVHLMNLGT